MVLFISNQALGLEFEIVPQKSHVGFRILVEKCRYFIYESYCSYEDYEGTFTAKAGRVLGDDNGNIT